MRQATGRVLPSRAALVVATLGRLVRAAGEVRLPGLEPGRRARPPAECLRDAALVVAVSGGLCEERRWLATVAPDTRSLHSATRQGAFGSRSPRGCNARTLHPASQGLAPVAPGEAQAPRQRQGALEHGGPCGRQALRVSVNGSRGSPLRPGTPAYLLSAERFRGRSSSWWPSSDGWDRLGWRLASDLVPLRLEALLRGHRLCPAGTAFRPARASCPDASDGSRVQGCVSLLVHPSLNARLAPAGRTEPSMRRLVSSSKGLRSCGEGGGNVRPPGACSRGGGPTAFSQATRGRRLSTGSVLRCRQASCLTSPDGSPPAAEGACFFPLRAVAREVGPQGSGWCAGPMWPQPDAGLVPVEGRAARSLDWSRFASSTLARVVVHRSDCDSSIEASSLGRASSFGSLHSSSAACLAHRGSAFGLAPGRVGEVRPACRARSGRARFG